MSSETILAQIPDVDSVMPLIAEAEDGFESVLAALPADPLTPLSEQLGALGDLLPEDPQAAWTGGLESGLEQLGTLLPEDATTLLQPVLEGLSGLDSLVTGTPLGALLDGDGNVAEAVLGQLPALTGPFQELVGQLPHQLFSAEQVGELEAFLEAIAAFEADIPSEPGAIAAFLAQSFVSLPQTLLAPLADVTDNVLGGLDNVIALLETTTPASPANLARDSLLGAASFLATMDVTNPAHYDVVQPLLNGALDQLQVVEDDLAIILDAVEETLDDVNLDGLQSEIETAVAAITVPDVITVNDIRNTILGVLATLIEQMTATDPAMLATRLQAITAQIESALEELGLDQAQQLIFGVFEEIVAALEAVDLEAVTQTIEALFDTVQETIGALDVEQITATIAEVLGQAEQLLDTIDLAALVETVSEQVEQVTAALGSIPLEALRDQIESVFTAVEAALGELEALAATVSDMLESIVASLDEIDFGTAAEPAIAAMNEIAALLDSIAPETLPAPLQQALSAAVAPLEAIDFEGEITKALVAAYDEIAAIPQAAATEIEAGLDAVQEKLSALDPAELLAPLQAVYEQLLAALASLDPGALLDPVEELLAQLAASLEALDPAALFAPLQVVYDELLAAFDSLDPAGLLAPLEAALAEFEALVARLDLAPLFAELTQLQNSLFEQVTSTLVDDLDLSGLPPGAGGLLETVKPMLGMGSGSARPGDLFLPLADLYDQLLEAIAAVPDDLLLDSFNQLREELVGALERVVPATLADAIVASATALATAYAAVDPEPFGAELGVAHTSLVQALDALDETQVPAGLSDRFAALENLVAELAPEPLLAPLQMRYESQQPRVQALTTPVDLSGLEATVEPLQAQIEGLVPPFLLQELTADSLQQGLEAFSPAGIAAEVNAVYDEFHALAVTLEGVVGPEIEAMLSMLGERLTVVEPAALQTLFTGLMNTLQERLALFDPALWQAELEETFAAARSALTALDPAVIAAALQDSFAAVQEGLAALDLTPLREALDELQALVQARVKVLDPALLAERLGKTFDGIETFFEELEIVAAIRSFGETLAELRDDLVATLAAAQGAFDEMLNAIPV